MLQELRDLAQKEKFVEAFDEHYPGAPTPEIRIESERNVNKMISRLRSELPKNPTKTYVISEFLLMLKDFEGADTEEREHAAGYCEEVMTILGIESSDGALNTWLYGFDPMA